MKKTIVIALSSLAVLSFTLVAKANPTFFPPTLQSASATTSVSYITPGTATSTLTYDTFVNGNTNAANKVTLLTQFAGSSSASTLNLNIEYSQDGVDWYQNNLFSLATTSPTQSLQTINSYSWKFASTTVGGVALTNANSATSSKAIVIDTPTRFVRAVYSLAAGGTNGAIWSQMVPAKEKAE